MNINKYLFMMVALLTVCMVSCFNDSSTNNIITKSDMPSGSGLFSISPNQQVRIAPGNLVYEDGIYGFTVHQYDYGGLFGWDMVGYLNFEGGWRILTRDEWHYIIVGRPYADWKRGAATVCGVHGMVLLPDDWNGDCFVNAFNGWTTNVYDESSWAEMESSGAVFLPASGYYYCSEVFDVGEYGYYWTSTSIDNIKAYGFGFRNSTVSIDVPFDRSEVLSVRLAKEYN